MPVFAKTVPPAPSERNCDGCAGIISACARNARSCQRRGLVRSGDRFSATRIFEFVEVIQAEHSVATMYRVLGVSTSGYYAWRHRRPSARAAADAALTERIKAIHAWSGGTYGTPRIHPELADEGWRIGRKRVARLMRETGLQGVTRRRGTFTTVRDEQRRPYPDRVERAFVAEAPNELYVADITYIPTWAGFLYLAVVLDVFSRRIVGWSMATHLRSALVLDALEMALWQRKPEQVIHHSDQGCPIYVCCLRRALQGCGSSPFDGVGRRPISVRRLR